MRDQDDWRPDCGAMCGGRACVWIPYAMVPHCVRPATVRDGRIIAVEEVVVDAGPECRFVCLLKVYRFVGQRRDG